MVYAPPVARLAPPVRVLVGEPVGVSEVADEIGVEDRDQIGRGDVVGDPAAAAAAGDVAALLDFRPDPVRRRTAGSCTRRASRPSCWSPRRRRTRTAARSASSSRSSRSCRRSPSCRRPVPVVPPVALVPPVPVVPPVAGVPPLPVVPPVALAPPVPVAPVPPVAVVPPVPVTPPAPWVPPVAVVPPVLVAPPVPVAPPVALPPEPPVPCSVSPRCNPGWPGGRIPTAG